MNDRQRNQVKGLLRNIKHTSNIIEQNKEKLKCKIYSLQSLISEGLEKTKISIVGPIPLATFDRATWSEIKFIYVVTFRSLEGLAHIDWKYSIPEAWVYTNGERTPPPSGVEYFFDARSAVEFLIKKPEYIKLYL